MRATNLGFYNTSVTRTHVRFQFSTHASAGANVAPLSAFENADLRIYKATDGAAFSATQRSSANGITMTSPFDSLTGFHDVDIDLTDNTDAGFYAAGSLYAVVLAPDTETIDGQTVTAIVLAYFEIGVMTANVTQNAGTAITSAAGIQEVKVASIAANAITATAIAADAITAAKVADGTIDAATFAASAITATAIAADAITAAKIADGAIDAATFAASAITATAIAADAITAAKIADGAIDAATFAASAITATAIASDAITAAKIADGAIDAATFAANAITSTVLADNAITANKIAADAIGASELAADAVTEIQSGLATSASITTLTGYVDTEVAAILAAVDTEVAAILALLDDPRAEPGQGAPPVNGDLATKLDYLYKWARNKKDNDGARNAYYADDGTTIDHKQTTTELAGTVTVGEMITGA